MISVERYVLAGDRVLLDLRVDGTVDRADLDGVGGQVRPGPGGDWVVAWDWPVAMAPVDADQVCIRHVRDVLTRAAMAWLGGGGQIDLGGGTHG